MVSREDVHGAREVFVAGKVDWERLGRSLTAWLREMGMKAVMRWEAEGRRSG